MNKANPIQVAEGAFISFSALPYNQQQLFGRWLPDAYLQPVQIEGQQFTDCVAYEDYEFWFEHHYRAEDLLLEEAL